MPTNLVIDISTSTWTVMKTESQIFITTPSDDKQTAGCQDFNAAVKVKVRCIKVKVTFDKLVSFSCLSLLRTSHDL